MTPIPVTLATAAAAVFLNIWLGSRIAAHRRDFKCTVGDGGHEPLIRRMRAQANYIEHAPFFLILLLGLELSGANRWALGAIASVFVVARIAHGLGMDADRDRRLRGYGMIFSALAGLVLALWALVCVAEICLGFGESGRREAFIRHCNEEGAGGMFTSREYCEELYDQT